MPTYDFSCPFCGHAAELFLPISKSDIVRCTNPKGCDGIMEKSFRNPPMLHGSCTPTRIKDIAYREKPCDRQY